MLAKKYRLTAKSFPRGKHLVARGRYFLCKRFASSLPYARHAVVVSSQILPRASARNRLRRAAYSALQACEGCSPIGEYVWVALASIKKADERAIINELITLCGGDRRQ